MANALMEESLRGGRILDIGCGSFPMFLKNVSFREKYGLDQVVTAEKQEEFSGQGITLVQRDLEQDHRLPFPDGHFAAVTMLAVFEHIRTTHLPEIVREIRRVLQPGGFYILTTPASWTNPILETLSALRLLSSVEIDEHEEIHTHASIRQVLSQAGFSAESVRCGSFELGMNLWATARKE